MARQFKNTKLGPVPDDQNVPQPQDQVCPSPQRPNCVPSPLTSASVAKHKMLTNLLLLVSTRKVPSKWKAKVYTRYTDET